MAKPDDKVSAGPSNGERLVPSQMNGAAETTLGILGTPEPVLRLQRTQGVWQIPEFDASNAEAVLELWPPGSFLVIGHNPNQVLVLKTGYSPRKINTYQIQKLPGGVTLESSNLCMPDLPHLLAFLSASRDILPRTLLLPPSSLGPGDQTTDSLQTDGDRPSSSGRVLSMVNKLYLDTHGQWEMQQIPAEAPSPETTKKPSPAPRNPTPHRVSWVEGPLSPEEHPPGPALASLAEQEEKELDIYKDEEKGSEDVLTRHVRALVRARSSYVARQFRGFRARLTSEAGPHRPGDPATELLQDMRHLLTDLQDHLEKDPDARAVFESRGIGVPQKDEDLVMRGLGGNLGSLPGPPGIPTGLLLALPLCPPLASFSPPLLFPSRLQTLHTVTTLFATAPSHTCHRQHPFPTTHAHACPHLPHSCPHLSRPWAGVGPPGPTCRPSLTHLTPAGPAVEAALCRAVLAPLKPVLWMRLRTFRAPELRRLRRRQIALRAGAGPPGAQGAGPEGQGPASTLRNRIHARLEQLHAACAPRRKVALLLAVCRDIYEGLAPGDHQEPLGADAFLPALTEELIWSPDIGETQLDVEFLMELLDPEELMGEAGYYLTTWFGALHHIAHYQEDTDRAPQGLSNEARASLRQWHRRRTLHGQGHAEAKDDLPFEEPWVVETVPRDQ